MAQSLAGQSQAATSNEQPGSAVLDRIGDALRGLRYGAVTVIVQDGVVVQVDRTEKLRLSPPPPKASGAR